MKSSSPCKAENSSRRVHPKEDTARPEGWGHPPSYPLIFKDPSRLFFFSSQALQGLVLLQLIPHGRSTKTCSGLFQPCRPYLLLDQECEPHKSPSSLPAPNVGTSPAPGASMPRSSTRILAGDRDIYSAALEQMDRDGLAGQVVVQNWPILTCPV